MNECEEFKQIQNLQNQSPNKPNPIIIKFIGDSFSDNEMVLNEDKQQFLHRDIKLSINDKAGLLINRFPEKNIQSDNNRNKSVNQKKKITKEKTNKKTSPFKGKPVKSSFYKELELIKLQSFQNAMFELHLIQKYGGIQQTQKSQQNVQNAVINIKEYFSSEANGLFLDMNRHYQETLKLQIDPLGEKFVRYSDNYFMDRIYLHTDDDGFKKVLKIIYQVYSFCETIPFDNQGEEVKINSHLIPISVSSQIRIGLAYEQLELYEHFFRIMLQTYQYFNKRGKISALVKFFSI